jgi:putative membrane protein
LQRGIDSFYEQQGKAERIKNFPYPRNFSSITTYLLHLFVILLPFGLLKEFNRLGDGTILEGYTIYFIIPFATIVGWAFVSLDAVGDSSINPFEGSANDVPITQISKMIETDLKEMIDDPNLPAAVVPVNNILM